MLYEYVVRMALPPSTGKKMQIFTMIHATWGELSSQALLYVCWNLPHIVQRHSIPTSQKYPWFLRPCPVEFNEYCVYHVEIWLAPKLKHQELTRSKTQKFLSYWRKNFPGDEKWEKQKCYFLKEPHGGFSLETDKEWREFPLYIGVVNCYKSFMVLGICGDKYFQYIFRCILSNICIHDISEMDLPKKNPVSLICVTRGSSLGFSHLNSTQSGYVDLESNFSPWNSWF